MCSLLPEKSQQPDSIAATNMKLSQLLLLLTISVGLALGQVLFKKAANQLRLDLEAKSIWFAAISNGELLGALALYAVLTVLWVYALMDLELSKAYPFMALTMVMTPLLAAMIFHERLDRDFFIGMAAIVIGLYFVARSAPPG
jgi:drug/metabolite transporter (DMT)-like permease